MKHLSPIFAFALVSASLTSVPAMADDVRTIVPKENTCAAVTQAIHSMPDFAGTIKVELPAGEFLCDSPVIIDRDNTIVEGQGPARTIFKAKDGVAIPVIVIGSVQNTHIEPMNMGHPDYRVPQGTKIPYPDRLVSNITLSGVSADGNYHNHDNPGDFECWDPATNKSQSCEKDVGRWIRNNGLTVRGVKENVNVINVETKSNFSGGMVTEKWVRGLTVNGFKTSDNWFDGLACYETEGTQFKHVTVDSNRFSGISVDAFCSNNHFTDLKARNNGDNGVFSNNVSGNTYDGVSMRANQGYGFFIEGQARDPDGELLQHLCDNNEIHHAKIEGPRQGIYINHHCPSAISQVAISQPKKNCEYVSGDNAAGEVQESGNFCTDKVVVQADSADRPQPAANPDAASAE